MAKKNSAQAQIVAFLKQHPLKRWTAQELQEAIAPDLHVGTIDKALRSLVDGARIRQEDKSLEPRKRAYEYWWESSCRDFPIKVPIDGRKFHLAESAVESDTASSDPQSRCEAFDSLESEAVIAERQLLSTPIFEKSRADSGDQPHWELCKSDGLDSVRLIRPKSELPNKSQRQN